MLVITFGMLLGATSKPSQTKENLRFRSHREIITAIMTSCYFVFTLLLFSPTVILRSSSFSLIPSVTTTSKTTASTAYLAPIRRLFTTNLSSTSQPTQIQRTQIEQTGIEKSQLLAQTPLAVPPSDPSTSTSNRSPIFSSRINLTPLHLLLLPVLIRVLFILLVRVGVRGLLLPTLWLERGLRRGLIKGGGKLRRKMGV